MMSTTVVSGQIATIPAAGSTQWLGTAPPSSGGRARRPIAPVPERQVRAVQVQMRGHTRAGAPQTVPAPRRPA